MDRGRRWHHRVGKSSLLGSPPTQALPLTHLQYLAKPPRTVSQQYPPGELPPPAVIAEIARQILKFEQLKSAGWTRSFEETRGRVFHIARQDSMRQVGGYHRRTPSDPKSMEDRPELTAEVDLAQVIDHVEQEMVIPEFSHFMR